MWRTVLASVKVVQLRGHLRRCQDEEDATKGVGGGVVDARKEHRKVPTERRKL